MIGMFLGICIKNKKFDFKKEQSKIDWKYFCESSKNNNLTVKVKIIDLPCPENGKAKLFITNNNQEIFLSDITFHTNDKQSFLIDIKENLSSLNECDGDFVIKSNNIILVAKSIEIECLIICQLPELD